MWLLSCLLYRRGKCSSERVGNFPKATQPIYDQPRNQNQAVNLKESAVGLWSLYSKLACSTPVHMPHGRRRPVCLPGLEGGAHLLSQAVLTHSLPAPPIGPSGGYSEQMLSADREPPQTLSTEFRNSSFEGLQSEMMLHPQRPPVPEEPWGPMAAWCPGLAKCAPLRAA